MNYQIYCASYKRGKIATTHKYLPSIIYVVDSKEADEYKELHDKVLILPDGIQGNLSRVRNWILDNAEEENIILLDDDMKYFGRWNGNVFKKLDSEGAHNMIIEGIQLAKDLDVRFWGLNCLADKGAYREYTPFGTCQYIGGPFQAHRNNECRYEEIIYLKEDYDMTLQVLNKYRKNLRLNMYNYTCEQNTMKGGCAVYRNIETEMNHNQMLQEKWGNKIVRFDTSNKTDGKRKTYDINPIINAPIKGV